MDRVTRQRLIDQYRAGHAAVVQALQGISPRDLDRRPTTDEWSPREIVHHLADSEMTSAIRLRRLLAEDQPIIQAYDEWKFSEVLHYADRPIEAALLALQAARATTAEILDRLTETEWTRQGTHSESGPYGVETWLEIYAAHAHDHAAQLTRAREAAARGATATA